MSEDLLPTVLPDVAGSSSKLSESGESEHRLDALMTLHDQKESRTTITTESHGSDRIQ